MRRNVHMVITEQRALAMLTRDPLLWAVGRGRALMMMIVMIHLGQG